MKTEGIVILVVGGDNENMLMLMTAVGWNDGQVEDRVECVDGSQTVVSGKGAEIDQKSILRFVGGDIECQLAFP